MRSMWAQPNDRAALQALWKNCFGDGEDVSGAFFDAFPPETHTRVIKAESRVASMVSIMPVRLCAPDGDREGAYIYAVATDPEFRGRGLCRALMGETEPLLFSGGAEFLALWPAEESLFRFYGKMGYHPAFPSETRRVLPTGEGLPLAEISGEEYMRLRETPIKVPFCRWNHAAYTYLENTAVRFFRFPGGCGACFPLPGGGIRVPELLGVCPEDFCASLCAPFAVVTVPGGNSMQGMIKWRDKPQIPDPIHLGFAFD